MIIRNHLTDENEKLLRSITTKAGYELLSLPIGDSNDMSKHKNLNIKINSISIPLHKAIHYKVIDEIASNSLDENAVSSSSSSPESSDSSNSNSNNDDNKSTTKDALSEMVNDLKSGTDFSETNSNNSSSSPPLGTFKPLSFLERLMALAFRLAYLVQKRAESSHLESQIDYSQYAPGSVVVSIPVHVTFTGSGTEERTMHSKVDNATKKVTEETIDESVIPVAASENATKVTSTYSVDWKSRPETALLYFTGCISGHSELEWRLSHIRIMNDYSD